MISKFFALLVIFCTTELYASNQTELDLEKLGAQTGSKKTFVTLPLDRVYKKYHGCYRDREDSIFKRQFIFGDSTTIDHCIHFCMVEGYVYAGLEYHTICYCGNKFPKNPPYEKLNENQCNSPCKGAQHEMCGGAWALSIYETGNQIFVIKQDGIPAIIENESFWLK